MFTLNNPTLLPHFNVNDKFSFFRHDFINCKWIIIIDGLCFLFCTKRSPQKSVTATSPQHESIKLYWYNLHHVCLTLVVNKLPVLMRSTLDRIYIYIYIYIYIPQTGINILNFCQAEIYQIARRYHHSSCFVLTFFRVFILHVEHTLNCDRMLSYDWYLVLFSKKDKWMFIYCAVDCVCVELLLWLGWKFNIVYH